MTDKRELPAFADFLVLVSVLYLKEILLFIITSNLPKWYVVTVVYTKNGKMSIGKSKKV